MTKALALLSGGLDSTLAIEVIKRQGIEVVALNIVTAFCRCTASNSCQLEAVKVSEKLNVPIKVINATREMIEIVKKPKFGFGKNINPCIDCRINLFHTAGKYMKEIGASFIFTGEVLGQRPMSQRKDAMKKIDKEANLTGYVLRPLCAKHLEPTIPEKDGLVDREQLLAIKGRSRKEQMQLADIFEIKDYRCPAGGCLLTDSEFAHRMRDLLKYSDASVNDVNLLKVGRHFRVDPNTKIVVGRREEDNPRVEAQAQEGDFLFLMEEVRGPSALLRGDTNDANIELAASLTARYSKEQDKDLATVKIIPKGKEDDAKIVKVVPLNAEKVIELMIRKPEKKKKDKPSVQSIGQSIDKSPHIPHSNYQETSTV
ncbi:MAG: hypothetical protein ACUZ8H_03545 [Candidatus Anammoxibacter sp.]